MSNSLFRGVCVALLTVAGLCQSLAGDAHSEFTRAWDLYARGYLDDALVIVVNNLEKGIDNTHLRANYHYLKGNIHVKHTNQEPQAQESFVNARTLYEQLGMARDVYAMNLGLASVHMKLGQYDLAEVNVLDSIMLAQENDFPVGYAYSLLAKVAFKNHDFTQAMNLSFYSLWAFQREKDTAGIVDAQLSLGFYQMLVGYVENGNRLTRRAQRALVKLGDENKYDYSYINVILYERLNGRSADDEIETVRNRIAQDDDDALAEWLDFVLNYGTESRTTLLEGEPPKPTPSTPAGPAPPDPPREKTNQEAETTSAGQLLEGQPPKPTPSTPAGPAPPEQPPSLLSDDQKLEGEPPKPTPPDPSGGNG